MMISDSAAGAPKDVLLRQMAKALQVENPTWRIVVDDKAGGDGAAAMQYLLSQPADGSTLLIQSASFEVSMNTSLASLFKVSQFDFICQTDSSTFVLATNPRLNIHSLKELVQYAANHHLSVTGYGQNSLEHYATALLARDAGFKYSWVPYQSGSMAVTAVVGGNVDAVMVDTSAASQFINSGKLNGILVTSKERDSILPKVPSVAELGHPNDVVYIWHTFLVKAGTPADIRQKLESAISNLPKDKAFSEFLKSASIEWKFTLGAEFSKRVAAEMSKIKASTDLLKK